MSGCSPVPVVHLCRAARHATRCSPAEQELHLTACMRVAVNAGVPSTRHKEAVRVQQPMGAITGQGPPGPAAPAPYRPVNMDVEKGGSLRSRR